MNAHPEKNAAKGRGRARAVVFKRSWQGEGDQSWCATEIVRHEVELQVNGRKVVTYFESTGTIFLCDPPDGEARERVSVPWATLVARGFSAASTPTAIFEAWLTAASKTTVTRSMAYSEDGGSQIGGMRYRLVRANDVQLAGPVELSDQYREFKGPPGADGSPIPYEDEGFYLLHVLSEAEARVAGLVPPEAGKTTGTIPPHQSHGVALPAWAAANGANGDTWIDRDTLARSSQDRGILIPQSLTFRIERDGETYTRAVQRTHRRLPPALTAMLEQCAGEDAREDTTH